MIPNRLIFIWLGPKFPWSGGIAIRSAYQVHKPQSIWLVHEGMQQEGDGWDLIKDIEGRKSSPYRIRILTGLTTTDSASSCSMNSSPRQAVRTCLGLRSSTVMAVSTSIPTSSW